MALTNNFISPTNLVFQPRDFSQQIAQKQADGTRALQNMFKFGTQVYDAYKNRQIADEMAKDDPDYKKIDSLAAQRINSPDTTFSNWRWKQGQELTKEENKLNREAAKEQREEDLKRIQAEKDAAKELAKRQMANKITNTLGTMQLDLNTTPEQAQAYKNTLGALMTEAQNAGIEDLKPITDKIGAMEGPLPYDQMQDLMTQIELYDKYYDTMNSGEDGYGSKGNYATYQKNLEQNVWQKASDQMKRNREFRAKYADAINKHKKKVKKPGTKPSGRRK